MNGSLLLLTLMLAADSTGTAPDWVGRESWTEPPARYRTVSSELFATPERALNDALGRAASVARDFLVSNQPEVPRDWGPPRRLVHDEWVRDEHVERVEWTYGPMYRAHLLVRLEPENRDRLYREWRDERVGRRLSRLGGAVGFLLVCLTALVGYLRLDDATLGYYTPWLFSGAVALVAGSAAGLYALLW